MLVIANHRPKTNLETLRHFFLSIICLVLLFAFTTLAQSGRQRETTDENKTVPTVKRGRLSISDANESQATSFIVATALPERIPKNLEYSYSRNLDLEYEARRAVSLELKKALSAKVIEDEDIERREARETAMSEDETWVVWIEIKWENDANQLYATSFRVRYLLFEPGTGKLKSSSFGVKTKQTWGTSQQQTSFEEQAREAGRSIADQIIDEFRQKDK